MKDDNLNDTQRETIKRPGGYCPMCDTVYDRPHKCVGKPIWNALKEAQNEMDKAVKNYGRIDFESKLVCEIWNEAIEAAAELFPYGEWEEINIAAKIRKLKK